MMAYILSLSRKKVVYHAGVTQKTSAQIRSRLRGSIHFSFQQHAGPFDLLAAERAEEVRDQAVHQLEIRRQGGRVLLRVVEDFLAVALRIDGRAAAAVDEDELRLQDKALALHVGAHGNHPAPAEAVVDLCVALDET